MKTSVLSLILFATVTLGCQSPSGALAVGGIPSDLRTLLRTAPHEELNFSGHYGRNSRLDSLPEIASTNEKLEEASTVIHVRSELYVVDAALLPTEAPLAVRIEADACGRLMSALVAGGYAERLHTPQLTCNDGTTGFASLTRQHSVVRGFDLKATGPNFITEPDVTNVQDGLRLSVIPTAKAQDKVSLAVTLDSTQMQEPIPVIETNYGIKIQTPTFLNQHLQTKALLGKDEGILVAGIQATDRTGVIIALVRAEAQDLHAATR